jgi:gamma-glutamyl hercynylcysteine S-oxide synthase
MPVIEASTRLVSDLASIREQLASLRAESDRLFAILTEKALYERPIAERHRVIFYFGHFDGFDSIEICREGLGLPSPDPELDALFQAGIDPDSSHLPSDQPADWPSFDQVKAYVARCRKRVDENLDRASEEVVAMAIEHRQMHLETLAYMFHNFDYRLKRVSAVLPLERSARRAPANPFVEIPAGETALGKAHDGTFGWDNEYELLSVRVPAFCIQQNSVSNGEYLRFVEQGARLPHFWVRRDGDLYYRGMFEEIPLPLDWPVYVTHTEAASYAQWLGMALPAEEQFHRAAYATPSAGDRLYPWGDSAPSRELGNFNFRRWDPEPVDAAPAGQSAFGVNQLIGNGWQWTRTAFAPLPGFKPHPLYPGYSANFFDGEHFVMKGGSARTAARLLRKSFRNWFRRDYPYMYATFRCVENS